MDQQRTTSLKAKDLFQEKLDPKDVIALANGAPGPETMEGCKEVFMEATKHALSDPEEEKYIFQYGPRLGDPQFRSELAKFLSKEYGDTVESNNLMVTSGATHGLHFVASVMMGKDTPIFVEDPTYFIATGILSVDLGYRLIPVPTDDFGLDVDALEKLILENRCHSNAKCQFTSMLYCMTVLSNPTGKTLPPDRCKKLIELARKYDVLLFSEDVYNLLNYSENKNLPPRLLSYDKKCDPSYKGNTISNCTFSKIIGPGLRLGWLEGTENIIQHLRKGNVVNSSGSFNHYTSRIVTSAFKLGLLTNFLDKLRAIYKERMDTACELIRQRMGSVVKLTNPQGGFFLWLELPEKIDGKELLQYTKENYNLNFITGESTSPSRSFKNCIRLSISFCTKDKIAEGIEKLHKALQHFL